MSLKTVILPVAGKGTRLLPATKSTPKELLPVYDTPLLHFALNEAIAVGAERIVLVSHKDKPAIEDFVADASAEISDLHQRKKFREAQALERVSPPSNVDITIVHQDEQLGLGHAVLCAREQCLDGPFGVILPDDVMLSGRCLTEMWDAFRSNGFKSLIAAMEVSPDETSKYGMFKLAPFEGTVRAALGIVEKPEPSVSPSLLAAVGRYILSPETFDVLNTLSPGAGGEIQLTDAIDAVGKLSAYPISEQRFDCGSKEGLFEAGAAYRTMRQPEQNIALAAE